MNNITCVYMYIYIYVYICIYLPFPKAMHPADSLGAPGPPAAAVAQCGAGGLPQALLMVPGPADGGEREREALGITAQSTCRIYEIELRMPCNRS